MAFSITYDASVVDGSLSVSDYLTNWSAQYTAVYYNHAANDFTNYDGYWATTNQESGNIDYQVACTINGITGIVSDGTWGFDSESYEFFDNLNTLHFGEDLELDATTGFYLSSEAVTFEGLGDIISDAFYTNICLLSGDISFLLSELENAGIDTMASLDSYAPMTETEESDTMVDTTGIQDNSDTLMAA